MHWASSGPSGTPAQVVTLTGPVEQRDATISELQPPCNRWHELRSVVEPQADQTRSAAVADRRGGQPAADPVRRAIQAHRTAQHDRSQADEAPEANA